VAVPAGDLYAVLTTGIWAWHQRGCAASGGRKAEDDNAAAGSTPTNAHDAQVPGPRRLRYVCRPTPTHTCTTPTLTPYLHMCLNIYLHIPALPKHLPECLNTPELSTHIPQASSRRRALASHSRCLPAPARAGRLGARRRGFKSTAFLLCCCPARASNSAHPGHSNPAASLRQSPRP
jgi:hypothetical protein